MYTTRLLQLLLVALSVICVAHAFPGDLHSGSRRIIRRQNTGSSSGDSSNAAPTSAAETVPTSSAAVESQSETAPSASATQDNQPSTVIVTNTIETTAPTVPQTTEKQPQSTSEESVSSTDPVPDTTSEQTTAVADPTTVPTTEIQSSINNEPVPTSSSSEPANTSVPETTAAPLPTSTAANDVTSSDNKDTQKTTFTPVTSTFVDVVTRTNSDGALETMTTTTKSTSTPGLNSNDNSSSSSGMSTKTRNTVIGVVVGVGGAIVVGALGLVAWRIWGRKKQAEENDGLMNYNSGYNPVEKSEPGSSGGNSNPPQRNPFQSTLENYHQPTQVNASSNF